MGKTVMANVTNIEDSDWTGGIVRGADAMRRRRDVYGATVRFPLGDSIVQDNTGGLVVKDQFGKIIKTVDRHDKETHYDYNFGGELIRVDLPNGESFAKIENNEWIKVHSDRIIERTNKSFDILPDGTLRILCATNNGVKYLRDISLDGSESVINEHGRITSVRTDLKVQIARLYTVLDNLHRERRINFEQRQGACDALHGLLRRMALEEISEEQAAQTLFHICRLLEASTISPFGVQFCYMLCREILYFAALPDEAQAPDGLCALIRELYRRHPEQVANLVTDMGVSKSYATMSGVVVQYVDELMHPISRRMQEWTIMEDGGQTIESNRFLRVVLVNVLHRSRLDRVPNTSDPRKALSTREFGRVKSRELGELYEQVTGFKAEGITFKAPQAKEDLERSIPFIGGQNTTGMLH